MVAVYSDADYLSVYKQKRRLWWTFMGITLVYLAFCVSLLVYYTSLPYASPKQTLPKWSVYIVTALYVVFVFPFMSIKYGRARKYYRVLSYISTGLKNEETNYFYCFDEHVLPKDNIDVLSCVFETWNKKKSEWMEREAYFDPEMPLPPFESGDYVHYIVQSNFVIEYEILQKKALEFEEVDEFEEIDQVEEREEVEDKEETTEEGENL